jgi:hypothetical protein
MLNNKCCTDNRRGRIAGVDDEVLNTNDGAGGVEEQSTSVFYLACGGCEVDGTAGCAERDRVVLQRVILQVRDDNTQALKRADEAGTELDGSAPEVHGRSLRWGLCMHNKRCASQSNEDDGFA